jgi:hypothetical protein
MLSITKSPNMTSAAVNPTMRSHGWNVELLTAPSDVPFAGVFQPAKDCFMTFRDIVNEMRLSFEFQDESSDVWNEVAFGLLAMLNVSEDECPAPKFVHGNGLDQPVPALPELELDAPQDRAILQYRVFMHRDCRLSADQPSKCHFEGMFEEYCHLMASLANPFQLDARSAFPSLSAG